MKNFITLLMLTSLVTFSFSCKKDNAEDTPNGSFSAKINGTEWVSTVAVAAHYETQQMSQITATKTGTQDLFGINFLGQSTGTYPMDENNASLASIGGKQFSSIMPNTMAGEIIITKFDKAAKLMSGTFWFKAEDIDGVVYNVTDGKFNNIPITFE